MPALRVVGMSFISLLAFLHRRYVDPGSALWPVIPLTAFLLSYGAWTWVILRAHYLRLRDRLNLGSLFLYLDVPVWCVAIYASGAEHCWFSWVLVTRVADQANTSSARVAAMAHWIALWYLATIWLAATWGGHPISWQIELTKELLLYGFGLYCSATARTAEHLRQQTREAVMTSRALIAQLGRSNAELAGARETAERASQVKGEFLSLMSHEMRTPLNSIIGFSAMLCEQQLTTKQLSYVGNIHRSGQRLLNLFVNLLELVNLKTGHVALRVDRIDATSVVRSVLASRRDSMERKKLELLWLQGENEATIIETDAARLEQILVQIVDNAVQHSPAGGTVELSVASDPRFVQIEVIDHGPGIAPSNHERIFAELEQLDSSWERKQEGIGLGLTVSRRLARLLGGDVTVDSQLGQGARFRVTLPRETAAR